MRTTAIIAALLVCGSAQARTVSYGLAVGNNAPPTGVETPLPVLAYADDDAVRYWRFFAQAGDQALLLAVLDEATARRHPDALAAARAPTLAGLRAAVGGLAARMQADRERGDEPVLYFAFSGHGARGPDGVPFLALADAALTREALWAEVLERVPAARVHLFVDACHAEGVVGGRGEVDARLELVTADERRRFLEAGTLARFPHVGAILAAAVDQQAHEWSQLESGVFTHELLSALSGAADVNADGLVEYSEVLAFVSSNNRDVADLRAVPRVVAFPPKVDPHLPLARVVGGPGTAGALLAGASRLGHFHVELEDGLRYLDAHLSPELLARIALPLGRLFVVAGEQEAELVARAGEVFRLERLPWRRRTATARGAIEASLRRSLFSSPYGADYYQGYVDSSGLTAVRFRPADAVITRETALPRRPLAVATWAVGGAALVTAGAATAMAVQAKADFDATDLQRPAAEARQRCLDATAVAAVAGGITVAAALGGWALWPSEGDWQLLPLAGADGGGVALGGRW